MPFLASATAIVFHIPLQNSCVMHKMIRSQQHRGQLYKHLTPLRERRAVRDCQILALIAIADQFEQRGCFSLIPTDITQVIQVE